MSPDGSWGRAGARLQWAGDRTCLGLTLCPWASPAVASVPGPRASLLSRAWALPPTLVRTLLALTNTEGVLLPGTTLPHSLWGGRWD
ncbi:hypothetical protein PAL_GLEAN10022994 [Pteropus alecto]|uniref:Uncharacterized protein n=1 Tax=Pteropus alecto TaxID=9402 RepID=L5K5I2_PTEAL|nr:hypothetical protein PAL_GLEAN10022994 [Pteropus alecto]